MLSKKTILLFIDWYLPGYKAGGPIQSCANLVAHLQDDFNFKIVTRDTDYCETNPYEGIESNTWITINAHVQVYYFSAGSLNKKNIYNLIESTTYDWVYLNGVFSYFFTIVPLFYFRKKKDAKIIVAARGMLAKGALAIKNKKKQLFLQFANLLKLFKQVVFHATSEAEGQDIIAVFGAKSNIKIAGNLSKKIAFETFEPKEKEAGKLKLINVARVAPEKNLKFALELLKQCKSPIQFDFYGPVYEDAYFNACKTIIEQFPSHITANYKGVLPNAEVYNTLKNYDAMFMPTLGENFGHIILESLMASCPVIISDQTPWQHLEDEKAGWAIPLSDSQKFIQVLEHLAQCDEKTYMVYAYGAYAKAKSFIENTALISSNKALFN